MVKSRVPTVRDNLRIFTGQVLIVEDLAFLTGDETGLTLHARDQSVAVTRYWEAGERPELGRWGVSWHFSWALEADNRFRVAERLQQIRPVASMDALIIHQARRARLLLWDAVRALDVARGALVTVRVYAELILASGGA